MENKKYLRRKEAAQYLKLKYGVGSAKTLASLASEGGGPDSSYYGSRIPLYTIEALDDWMESKIHRAKPASDLSEKA